MFLVVLFLIKTPSILKISSNSEAKKNEGLAYGDLSVSELVNKDTDGDGVPDWEEPLWGTDPKNRDSDDDGVLDGIEIERMKDQGADSGGEQAEQPQTSTEKFSEELFATVAALNQNETIDQSAVDKLSDSLTDKVQNQEQKKVFAISAIKIATDNSIAAVTKYNNAMAAAAKEYKDPAQIIDVLKEFSQSGDEPDASILSKLDPFIESYKKTINIMLKVTVPQKLGTLHLTAINALEKLTENLENMQLYESDTIISIGAVSQYMNTSAALDAAILNLKIATWKGLGN